MSHGAYGKTPLRFPCLEPGCEVLPREIPVRQEKLSMMIILLLEFFRIYLNGDGETFIFMRLFEVKFIFFIFI
jgi:hypothetical protein